MLYLSDFDEHYTMVQNQSKSVRYSIRYDSKIISVINIFKCTMGAIPFYLIATIKLKGIN